MKHPLRMSRVAGSFRDPSGHVFTHSGRVFRGISEVATEHFRHFIESSFFKERAGTLIVNTKEISHEEVISAGISEQDVKEYAMWVEHEPIPFISYPYEWSFDALKSAARLTLELLISGLKNGYTLKDGSAFNIQFMNSKPIFMDVLSFRNYRNDEPFFGYKQFCEHFLAPLCLAAFSGIDFNRWFRGSLDGLDLVEVSSALPLSSYFRLNVLLHIHLQGWAIKKLESGIEKKQSNRPIPKKNLIALASGLQRFVEKLQRRKTSYWQKYAEENSYRDISRVDKINIAKEFIHKHKLRNILDLGCNAGEYSRAAYDAGAGQVIGIDFDCGAVDCATRAARQNNWPAQFLHYDISNPSPDMGWMRKERLALEQRLGKLDGVFCFALIHHITIAKNIPIEEFINWVCSLSPRGLIEFVPKSDPMVQGLLRHREDVFYHYTEKRFVQTLKNLCSHVVLHKLAATERKIYEFEK